MEQFSWTERQLHNEVSVARIRMISEYNRLREIGRDIAQKKAEAEARRR